MNRLTELEIEYTRFNARRTLKTPAESQLCVERYGDVIAFIDPARPLPGYPNRVLGLGPETLPLLDDILALYTNAGLVPEIQLRVTPEMETALLARGFSRVHDLGYLARAPALVAPSEITVERWGPARADELLDLFPHAGVNVTPEIRERRRSYYCTDTFRAFVALLDGSPAAWATLFVHEKQGIFANAWTLGEHRGRGCQTALLAARLRDATELGLDRVVTDLVLPSQSQRNVERAGFVLEHVDTVFSSTSATPKR
jgi:hypothetical protein